MGSGDVGARVVAALGEPVAPELLDRAELIGRLDARDDAARLAEVLRRPPVRAHRRR